MDMTTKQEPTLTVLHESTPIFTSHGKWLHPLFELEEYLADHAFQPAQLLLQDKIIGKAAALLIHRLGFRTVKAGVLSRLGEAVLQRHAMAYTYERLVDRIHCQTEELLATVEDPEEAYRLVKVRAGR
jgi:zinc transport system ATP-binding protein